MIGRSGQKKTGFPGFTLIEALVFLFLFSVIALTFYQLYAIGTRHILDAKRRLGAVALANQQMEMIRGVVYDDIGTKSPDGGGGFLYGIPPGEILEDETVTESGGEYDIHTFVQYVDDPFDGEGGGTDVIPADYKAVRVTVSWGDDDDEAYRSVSVFGTFAQDGMEQISGTGILSINVMDRGGVGVPQATVRIENATTGTDLTTSTDTDGHLFLPGAPPSDQEYEITVSKSGYYGAHTYPPSSDPAFEPEDEHAAVVEGFVNPFSIVMDVDADLPIRTVDPFGNPVSDIDFDMEGGRRIASDNTGDPVPIYDFSASGTTDGDGEAGYGDQSYGPYFFTLDASETAAYEILLRHSDAEAGTEILEVDPGNTDELDVVLLDLTFDSALFTVTDDETEPAPIEGASVRLYETVSGYDETVTTDTRGQAFFPISDTALPVATYSYEVSATDFDTETGTVSIDGTGLRKEAVSLTPST